MKNRMYNILKGTFLVSDGAFKNCTKSKLRRINEKQNV